MDAAVISALSAVFVVILSKVGDIIAEKIKRKDGKVDKREEQGNKLSEAVLALLQDRLYQACKYYISVGKIDQSDYDTVSRLYRNYHAMGGNGNGTDLYNKVKNIYLEGLES